MSASTLSKTSFFFYIAFVIFAIGSTPGSEDLVKVDDIQTSNQLRQILYSFVFLLSFISLLPKRYLLIDFVRAEKFLTLFLLWTFLSIFWSDFSFVSLKRWIQELGTVIVLVSALMHFRSADESLDYFKIILGTYIVLSLLAIVLFPETAIQWKFPAWRGLAVHKNILGQFSVMSLVFWSFVIYDKATTRKTLAIVFWVLSLILLLGSRSFTSLLGACTLVLLVVLFYIERTVIRTVIGKPASVFMVGLFFLTIVLVLTLRGDIITSLFTSFGRDMTFTGRTEIWATVLEEAKNHLFFGTGFHGFWNIPDSDVLDLIYEEFIWIPNQAHSGYVDLLNETGIVGISIFALMVIFYFINLSRLQEPHPWKWFVIAALFLNLQESAFFRLHNTAGVLFIFSYLALYKQILQNRLSPSQV